MAAMRRSPSGPDTGWEAHPLRWPARAAPGGRWGIEHRPTGRWGAYGSEARCRRLAAQLAEVDAILARAGALTAVPAVPAVVPRERQAEQARRNQPPAQKVPNSAPSEPVKKGQAGDLAAPARCCVVCAQPLAATARAGVTRCRLCATQAAQAEQLTAHLRRVGGPAA